MSISVSFMHVLKRKERALQGCVVRLCITAGAQESVLFGKIILSALTGYREII